MSTRVPKYRLHKASGQALIEIEGRRIYLGKHGTAESQDRYRQLVAGLLSPSSAPSVSVESHETTVNELNLRYFQYAKGYYTKDSKRTGEVDSIRAALRRLRRLYGHTAAAKFGPKAFAHLREEFIREGLSRKYINSSMSRIRRLFRWGVAEELIPPNVHQALSAVPGLRRGRTEARETDPITPADDAAVESTLAKLPDVVADLVRFQRLTGCRPTEACSVRPGDIDRSADVWIYRPASHKTEHHGRERAIPIGPEAQRVLAPYLLRAADAYCFCPADSEDKRRSQRHAERTTPNGQGNEPGSNRKRSPKRRAGPRYTKDSYNRAITRACELAEVPKWTPNQLRHARATEIRKAFGLEASQLLLGHSHANVTQIYAERDLAKAVEVAKAIG